MEDRGKAIKKSKTIKAKFLLVLLISFYSQV